jgi:hypothetical protein
LPWQTPIWNLVDGELRSFRLWHSSANFQCEAIEHPGRQSCGEEGTLSHSDLQSRYPQRKEALPSKLISGKIFIGIPYPWFEELGHPISGRNWHTPEPAVLGL